MRIVDVIMARTDAADTITDGELISIAAAEQLVREFEPRAIIVNGREIGRTLSAKIDIGRVYVTMKVEDEYAPQVLKVREFADTDTGASFSQYERSE